MSQTTHHDLNERFSCLARFDLPDASVSPAAVGLVRQASRVIHNWLPSASSFGLWVEDPSHLHMLIERLEQEVGGLWELSQAPSDPAQLAAASGRVFTASQQLDAFLTRNAAGVTDSTGTFPDGEPHALPDSLA